MTKPKHLSQFIDGSKVVKFRTLMSAFDEGRLIEAYDANGEIYRVDVSVLVPLLAGRTLEVKKKVKYKHIVGVK
jgi:hypothetical protein